MDWSRFAETLTLLGYLSAFHVLGGVAWGLGIRRWRKVWAESRTPPFLLLWGVLFGSLPLAFGLARQDWALLAAQFVVLAASIAAAFWLARPLREALARQYVFFSILGAVLAIVGAVAGALLLRSETQAVWQAFLTGGLFYTVGSLALAAGVVQWLKARRKAPAEPAPQVQETPPQPKEIE